MRRKPGAILPLEESVLSVAVDLKRAGNGRFHGFEMAKHLQHLNAAGRLTAHGTLYKALGRMEKAGLLESEWEDPELAAEEGRPRRRLYWVTGAGATALARLESERSAPNRGSDPGLAPA